MLEKCLWIGAVTACAALFAASALVEAQIVPSTMPATSTVPVSTVAKLPVAPAQGSEDASDYKIGSQDLLDISVYGQADFTRTVRVNSRGKISLPLVGQIDTVGLTALQVERLIADRLSENLLQNPQVTVFVKESLSARFTIEGAVGKPGVFPISGQVTLLRAIAIAGGKGSLGDLSSVKLFRTKPDGGGETLTFDIEKIRTGELPDPIIMNDDLIVVSQSKVRAAIKDSVFGDILSIFNPFGFIRP